MDLCDKDLGFLKRSQKVNEMTRIGEESPEDASMFAYNYERQSA